MRGFEEFVEFTTRSLELDQQRARRFADAVCREFAGEKFYVNKKVYYSQRDREIRGAFNGRNYAELSKQFGLCERQIRNIVA